METQKMRCKIISPTNTVFEGEVERVELPSMQGRMVVLSHHAPLLAVLTQGQVVVGEETFVVMGGLAKVKDNDILVMTDE